MIQKPEALYHGSSRLLEGPLEPVLRQSTSEHVHDRAAVFATDRIDIASLFMFPENHLASIGFEEGIAYICIWGTAKEFFVQDKGGYVYVLPSESFQKVGKNYEWQSFQSVEPLEIKKFDSVIKGIIACGGRVYFIDDDTIFDKIRDNKDNRMPILKNLKFEN